MSGSCSCQTRCVFIARCTKSPRPTGGKLGGALLGQPSGRADQMRPTRLTMRHPVLIHAVALADQHPLPIVNQIAQGVFGTVGMNQIQRHRVRSHCPQPLQHVLAIPRRFIEALVGFQGLMLRWASEPRKSLIRPLKNKNIKEAAGCKNRVVRYC